MHQVIARCRTGSSHIMRHKPCQDRLCHVQTPDFTLVAVADGHGSAEYTRSGLGARFAVYAAQKILPSDAPDEEVVGDIKWLYDHMVARHMARHPLSEREMGLLSAARLHPVAAYGCTLAVAVIDYAHNSTTRYCLGDSGVFCIDTSGHFPPPLPEDPACVGSATSSMCQSPETVKQHFRIQHLDGSIMAAVGVYSDGAEAEEWRAAEALFSTGDDEASEASMETRVEKLLKMFDHGDDQTFVLAVDPEAVTTDAFRAGVAEEVHRGHQVMALNRGLEKRKQSEVYLRLLLDKAKRLSGSEAVKFKDEVLRPAAEEFAALNNTIEVLRKEVLRKELEEVP